MLERFPKTPEDYKKEQGCFVIETVGRYQVIIKTSGVRNLQKRLPR